MSSVKQLRLNEGGAKKPQPKAPAAPAVEEPTPQQQLQDQVHEQEGEPDVMSVAKSIVKIFTSSNEPDAGMPYQLGRAQPSTGSGFFITYNGQPFVITNAHVVSFFTSVHIKKYGSARKWKATVLFVSDTNDLAVLTVDTKAFWRGVTPLPLMAPPQLNSEVFVCGYPTGGDELSVTSGVVSRYGVQPYAHSSDAYLTIQISAAINSGNSGGAVLQFSPQQGFGVVGVAFEAMMGANSIGYMIPTTVVNNMLEQWKTNNYGCPSLNIVTEGIESQTQRKSLFIPALSSLLDYLYDMSQLPMVVLKMLADKEGVSVEELIAAQQQQMEGMVVEGENGEEKGENAEKTTTDAAKAPTTKKAASPTPSEDGDVEGLPEGMEIDMGEGDMAPQHFIIGQDDEYDYVVFAPADEGEDEDDEEGFEGEMGEEDEDFEDEDEEDEEESTILVPKRSKSTRAPASTTPKSPVTKVVKSKKIAASPEDISSEMMDEDEEPTFELQLGSEDTPLFRIKRTSDTRPPPPVDLLPMLMSGNDINDTQVGILVRNLVPHSVSASLLQVGDVILAIDNIPVSSDETVLFRENERVRYSFLTTNRQIGTTCSILVLRGFDIFTVEVPIQQKASIAPIFYHRIPKYLVALGLLFVPLSGNLLQAEFGEEWTSAAPVNLMNALLQGLLTRFHADEEVIVLTQILPHSVTEGYEQAMERLTHVNGIRIINMTHLGTVLNAAVLEYDKNKAKMDKLKAKMENKTGATPPGAETSPVEDDLPEPEIDFENPALFYQTFANQLKAFAKVKYITFTLQSGSNITLNLEDGYKNQVDLLKLHQIPFPGCSESLLPMYDMTVDLKFKNPEITQEVVTQLLSPPEPKPVKSAQLAQILSPLPLSPRDSFRVTPHQQKLYPNLSETGKKNSAANNNNLNANVKNLSLLEAHPEATQKQFTNDFSPQSPVENLKKFKKNQDGKKKKPVGKKAAAEEKKD